MEQELLSAKVRLTIRRCTRWPTRFCSMILPDRDRRFRFGNTRIPFFMAPYILVCLIFLFILTRIYKTKEYNIAGGKEYFVEEYKKLGKVTLVEKKGSDFASVSVSFYPYQQLARAGYPVRIHCGRGLFVSARH